MTSLPATIFVPVTPHDDNAFSDNQPCRGIIVGTAGTIVAVDENDDEVAIYVVAGVVLPIATKHILATGTDAEDIVALF